MKNSRKEDISERKWQWMNGAERFVLLRADYNLNNAQEVKVARHSRALPENKGKFPFTEYIQQNIFIVDIFATMALIQETLHKEIRAYITFVWR
jgi:hypothetical protein